MRSLLVWISLGISGLPIAAGAQQNCPDPYSDSFQLRADCDALPAGSSERCNCFESFYGLTDWLWKTRKPTFEDRVVVDIGPGRFVTNDADPTCQSALGPPLKVRGFAAFRGAGRDVTILDRTGGEGFIAGFHSNGCQGLEFHDLTIQSPQYATIFRGGGWAPADLDPELDPTPIDLEPLPTSLFRNVRLKSTGSEGSNASSWTEEACDPGLGVGGGGDGGPGGTPGLHYFFDAILEVDAQGQASHVFGYRAACAETWFFDSVLEVKGQTKGIGDNSFVGVEVSGFGDVRAFGSLIRADASAMPATRLNDYLDPGRSGPIAVLVGETVSNVGTGGVFHAHGSHVAAVSAAPATGVPHDAIAIVAAPGAHMVHAPGATFDIRTAGIPVRQFGAALAPNLWRSGAFPPGASSETSVLESAEGADLFVETDCSASACGSAGSGSQAHLMIYNPAACAVKGGWMDVVTGWCRSGP